MVFVLILYKQLICSISYWNPKFDSNIKIFLCVMNAKEYKRVDI